MDLSVVGLELESFVVRSLRLSGVAFSFLREAQVVVAGGKGRRFLDCVFEERLRLVELLLLERVDAFQNEQLCLREMCSKVVQAAEFI